MDSSLLMVIEKVRGGVQIMKEKYGNKRIRKEKKKKRR